MLHSVESKQRELLLAADGEYRTAQQVNCLRVLEQAWDLGDEAKRNILGGNANRIFNLAPKQQAKQAAE